MHNALLIYKTTFEFIGFSNRPSLFKGDRTFLAALQQGYMVIELMTVVTVISLLAIVAIPAYQNHQTRTKIAAGIEEATPILQLVVESYQKRGEVWPTNNYEAGLFDKDYYRTKYVEHIEVRRHTLMPGNAIEVVLTYSLPELGDEKRIILTVSDSSGTTEWNCTRADKGTVPFFVRPDHCR